MYSDDINSNRSQGEKSIYQNQSQTHNERPTSGRKNHTVDMLQASERCTPFLKKSQKLTGLLENCLVFPGQKHLRSIQFLKFSLYYKSK